MISPSNYFDVEVLPGDTDMFMPDTGGLVGVVGRCEIFAKVEWRVGLIPLLQVTAVYRGGPRSLLGLIYDGMSREPTRELVKGVLCLCDVDMGSSIDLEDFEVFGMVGSGKRNYSLVHIVWGSDPDHKALDRKLYKGFPKEI